MIDHYTAVGTSISSKWGGLGGRSTNISSKVETAVIGAVEAQIGISDELTRYRQIVMEAERVISRVPQERFREILTLHYLAGMNLTDVARTIGYKYTENLYRAHGWALREAQKIIDEKEVGT